MTRHWVRPVLVTLISGVALWLALRQVVLSDVVAALVHAQLRFLLLALIFLLTTMWIKAERWCWLLDTTANLTRPPLIQALFIGYLGNVVLPARLGELVRAYAAGKLVKVPVVVVLSSIVIEKVLDIGTLLAFLWL